MNKRLNILTAFLITTVCISACSSNGSNSDQSSEQNIPQLESSTEKDQNQSTPGTYEDDYISFQYPGDLVIDAVPIQGSEFKGATSYRIKTQSGDNIFWISLSSPQENSALSLDDYVTSTNFGDDIILRKESLKIQSGEEAYYVEIKRPNDYDYYTHIPADNPKATYSLDGNYQSDEDFYNQYIKSDIVLNIIKSIKVKIK